MTEVNLRDNSAKTSFICRQGAAHGAQKLIAATRDEPADLRNSWKSSRLVISCTAPDAAIRLEGDCQTRTEDDGESKDETAFDVICI